MSSSAINQSVFQAKIGSVQNDADSSSVYSAGVWSFKNSTAVTGVTITNAGNVGIGNTAPLAKLTVGNAQTYPDSNTIAQFSGSTEFCFNNAQAYRVQAEVDSSTFYLSSNTYYSGGWQVFDNTKAPSQIQMVALNNNSFISFHTSATNSGNGTERMRITATGTIFSLPTYNNTSGAAVNMAVTASGEFVRSTSALKYKEEITPISFGLQTVLSMQPIEYKSKCEMDKDAAHKFIGFVADWEEANLPALVQKNGEGEVEGFSYDRLTAVLCKAIQEQQAQIEALKAEVAALKAP